MVPTTRFSATELLVGWWKETFSPFLTLKSFQLVISLSLFWLIDISLPSLKVRILASPETWVFPVGRANADDMAPTPSRLTAATTMPLRAPDLRRRRAPS
ncbi:hypothetical protein C4K18_1439 [Pseudomonas chlororaphis subsp. aurantiaca]|nr:hypothetical protein C4K18_1439 [Pseudomonas chlororaphis subsp. aurantiaca]